MYKRQLQKRLDLMGIIVLAITTACGGGILRDVLLQNGIPVFFTNYSYITTVIVAIVGTLAANKLYSCLLYTSHSSLAMVL